MNEKDKAGSITIAEPENSSRQSIENFIFQHPFLKGMTQAQLQTLADCAMQAHFAANEIVFKTGDPANRFYLIQQGTVALESSNNHERRLIQTIGAGDVLGWSWLFPPYLWQFDARSLEATDAVFVYGTRLREECESAHDLGYELFKRMTEVMLSRLQATRHQLLKSEGAPNPTGNKELNCF
jgi:CRP/FNR family transcriptional regulator, cyclic AMP receptor protein